MMKREWKALLNRRGRRVTIHMDGQSWQVRAFLQPFLDKNVQYVPTPLGLRREERLLYLGPADVALLPGGVIVEWDGTCYEVRSAREVGDGHHCWAVLQRVEDVA